MGNVIILAISKASIKMQTCDMMVLAVFLHGAERWTIKKSDKNRIEGLEMWCRRKMLEVSWRDLHTPYSRVLFWMTLSDLVKYSVTRHTVWSLCDSWASCSHSCSMSNGRYSLATKSKGRSTFGRKTRTTFDKVDRVEHVQLWRQCRPQHGRHCRISRRQSTINNLATNQQQSRKYPRLSRTYRRQISLPENVH